VAEYFKRLLNHANSFINKFSSNLKQNILKRKIKILGIYKTEKNEDKKKSKNIHLAPLQMKLGSIFSC